MLPSFCATWRDLCGRMGDPLAEVRGRRAKLDHADVIDGAGRHDLGRERYRRTPDTPSTSPGWSTRKEIVGRRPATELNIWPPGVDDDGLAQSELGFEPRAPAPARTATGSGC